MGRRGKHLQLAQQQAAFLLHRLEPAEIRRFCGAPLLVRGAPGDRNHARRLVTEALETYTSIGMARHSEITKALIERVP
jgi:hypothetical protein